MILPEALPFTIESAFVKERHCVRSRSEKIWIAFVLLSATSQVVIPAGPFTRYAVKSRGDPLVVGPVRLLGFEV